MTRITLSMILGAVVTSSWWGYSVFGAGHEGWIVISAVLLSILALLWIGSETMNEW